MPLPLVAKDPKGRYKPTADFVEGMIQSFKSGGKVPRRVVWEIVLGCWDVVKDEKSMVEVELPEGCTMDIVGDSGFSCLTV